MEIEIQKGSLLEADVEAIVNPANSQGRMGGGVAGVIKRMAGEEVEREAVAGAPIPVGKAIVTSGGKTRFRGIIHAPTMSFPAERIPVKNVSAATRAALTVADEKGFEKVAFPGMGTGVGQISPDDAARAMMAEIMQFRPKRIKRIVLVDINEGIVEAWKKVKPLPSSKNP